MKLVEQSNGLLAGRQLLLQFGESYHAPHINHFIPLTEFFQDLLPMEQMLEDYLQHHKWIGNL